MSVSVAPAASWWSTLWAEGAALAEEMSAAEALAAGVALEAVEVSGVAVAAGVVTIGLPEICIGILAVVVIVALVTLLIHPLANAFRQVPWVGGYIGDAVDQFGDWLKAGEAQVWNWAIGGIVGFFQNVYYLIYSLFTAPAHGIAALSRVCYWIIHNLVPYVWGNSLQHADQVAQQAQAAAESYTTTIAGGIYDELHLVERQMPGLVTQAVGIAEQWALGIFNSVYTEMHAIEATAAQNFAFTEQQIGDLVQSVPLQVGHALGVAEQYADNKVQQGITFVENELSPLIAAAATAAAGFGAILNKYLDTCGTDLCEAHGKNAKNVKNLAKDLEAGALFAFIAEAIKDPIDTANVTQEIVSPAVDVVGGAFNALVGVAV